MNSEITITSFSVRIKSIHCLAFWEVTKGYDL